MTVVVEAETRSLRYGVSLKRPSMETFCITGCKEAETMTKQRPPGERSHDTERTEAGGHSRKQINRSPAAETSLSPLGACRRSGRVRVWQNF